MRAYHENTSLVPEESLLSSVYIACLLLPSFITSKFLWQRFLPIIIPLLTHPSLLADMLILGNWIQFLQLTSAHLFLVSVWYSFKLLCGFEVAHPQMVSFSAIYLLWSSKYYIILYTIIFSFFEKISKEKFVVN